MYDNPPPAGPPVSTGSGPVRFAPPVAPPVVEDVVAVPAGPRPDGRSRFWKVAAGVVATIVLFAAGVVIGVAVDDEPAPADDPVAIVDPDTDSARNDTTDEATAPATDPAPATPTPLPVQPGPVADDVIEPAAEVARVLAPAVVRIDTGTGTGSGIFYHGDGLIVTNAHVVIGFDEVSVQLADGTRVAGEVVGVSTTVDVAVVRIDPDAAFFDVATFAPSSTVEVGQLAVAIGSPFGLEQSVTAGIVSAVNRVVTNTSVVDGSPTIVEMVQTDAPINPGNSGGALADRQGRVIGMNTSIRTDGATAGNLGVGFAIPSDTVILIADRIVAGTSTESGFLGVSGQDPVVGAAGALVTEVVPDGPAAAGGIESGDLIVAVNGEPVLGMAELAAKIRIAQPEARVQIDVVRDGEPLTLEVVLGTLGDS